MYRATQHDKLSLDYLFHPGSIAIPGVSSDTSKLNAGRTFLEALIDSGFRGRLYPVNRDGGQIFGLKIYPTIGDIPGSVDYVMSAIPARYALQLIADCARKGVKAVHMFTAGFSEIADKAGGQLEAEIAALAKQKGIRIIGPNCMGLYCPKTGLTFHPDFPRESGNIAFISQSGGHTIYIVREAALRGITFSKVISYGNACDLNESDFLEYLTHDPDTKVITAYIEGVKDGPRFLAALREAARVKPVIVYKGGITPDGSRAVASHTGAIAGSERVWESLLKQVGAIQTYSMEGLLNMVSLFTYMSPPKGKATAIIGIGGGMSVQAADACCRAGLTVPLLPVEIRNRLTEMYSSEIGASFRNPIDVYWRRSDLAQETIRLVADCDQIDLLIIHIMVGWNPRHEEKVSKPYIDLIARLHEAIDKPTAVVLQIFGQARFGAVAREAEAALYRTGFSIYPSFSQAANALVKFIDYHQRADLT